ncbi:MAG TPA: hypothetical protein VIW26_12035 [Gemmatimonadales bacterium]|jgi:hypothetical protein
MTDVMRYVPPASRGELEALDTEARAVVATEAVPKRYRGKVGEIVAAGLAGRERGIPLITALSYFDVIEGKPELNAAGCQGLVRRAGHSISGGVAEDGQSATAIGRRRDTGDEMTVRWTLDMAKRAGLTSKQVWKQYPEDMLWARAVDTLCRRLFSDVVMGLSPAQLDGGAFDPPVSNGQRHVDVETGEITTVREGSDSDITDAVIVDAQPPAKPTIDIDAYRARANALPGEWRKQLREALGKDGLGYRKVETFDDRERARALDLLEQVEAEAEATMSRRRKHAHAVCGEAGLDDGERHALIAYATDGAAASANALTEEQLAMVVQCCESVGDGSLVLAFEPDGTPTFRPADPAAAAIAADREEPQETADAPTRAEPDPERPF